METQQIITLALIVGIFAYVMLEQRNSHVRELRALDTLKSLGLQAGGITQSLLALAPDPVRKAAATLETATDSAEKASRELFGVDSPISKVADKLEDIGDAFFGEGETEEPELSLQAVDAAIYSNTTTDLEWMDRESKPSEEEDKAPDDKPAA